MVVLRGDAPIESGAEFMAHDVVAHVDDWRFQGINVWANWIHYIRTRGRLASPTLLLDELVTETDAIITARGRWSGVRGGRQVISRPCAARYRLVDGRIVEIWSTRGNYVPLCGAHVEYRWGFAAELLRARRWAAHAPQFDFTTGTRGQPVAFRSATTSGPLLAPAPTE